MHRRRFLETMAGATFMTSSNFTSAAPDSSARRRELYGLLGNLPDRNRKITARTVSAEERASYILDRIELD